MEVNAPRFDLTECRNAEEREFVEALHRRAEAGGWLLDSWPREDRIILTLDLCDEDPQYNCVLCMLRVDFNGTSLLVGPDETYQLVTDLDPERPDVLKVEGERPAVLAERAADWLEREMARPIERQEWDRPTFRHRSWCYADTQQGLVESDSENKKRSDLGPPDRVVRVSGRLAAQAIAATVERTTEAGETS